MLLASPNLSGHTHLYIWKTFPINSYKKELKLLFRFYNSPIFYGYLFLHSCLDIFVKLRQTKLEENDQHVVIELEG